MPLRMLAFAAASGKVAHVFLVGDRLQDWRISDVPKKSHERAVTWVEKQIDALGPDVVVTEDTTRSRKKGEPAKALIDAISALAEERTLLNPRIERQHDFANKYQEAEFIADRYPELKPWLTKWRRFFDNEPRNTVLFEAMSYALFILRNPTPPLARAMG